MLGYEQSPTPAFVKTTLASAGERISHFHSETSFQAMNSMDLANGLSGYPATLETP
jgi:hypothetical protein